MLELLKIGAITWVAVIWPHATEPYTPGLIAVDTCWQDKLPVSPTINPGDSNALPLDTGWDTNLPCAVILVAGRPR